jgi:hypothetical protein
MKRYYIYHIEGVKIGCTVNPNIRPKKQGYTNYSILEEHIDVYIASDREIELQKQYGYKVDTIPYWKTLKIATKEGRLKGGQKGGEWSIISGHIKKLNSLGGKAIAKINKENGHEIKWRTKGNIANSIIVEQRDISGNIINEFKSAREADRQTGINQSSIIKCCKGKVKKAGGYTFNYKNI